MAGEEKGSITTKFGDFVGKYIIHREQNKLKLRRQSKLGGVLAAVLAAYWLGSHNGAQNANEEAARELYLGLKPTGSYREVDDKITVRFSGIKGLNTKRPNEILIPGPEDKDSDGFPDSLCKLVLIDQNGNEIKTDRQARELSGKLTSITVRFEEVYGNGPRDPNQLRYPTGIATPIRPDPNTTR